MQATNQSDNPVKGFEAVILDEPKLNLLLNQPGATRQGVRIWSGRIVEIYDFEFPSTRSDSSLVDRGITPKYRFHLEVERVILPADANPPKSAPLLWQRESLAVAESKSDARFQENPGFYVEPRVRDAILTSLQEDMLIDLAEARVLPFSETDRATAGKRIALHPLHETFIGKEVKEHREPFYSKAPMGALVADIDAASQELAQASSRDEPLQRVQKVFTTRFKELFEMWEQIAAQLETEDKPPPKKGK